MAVRLVLDTEYSGIIGDNMLAPFLLTLASLYTLGYVSPQGSAVSSLLSAGKHCVRSCLQLVGAFDYYYSKQLHTIPRVIGAETLFSKLSNNIGLKLSALMLCGVQARLVGQLTRTLSFGQLLVHTFSLYLFTFFVSHIMIVTVIDKVI